MSETSKGIRLIRFDGADSPKLFLHNCIVLLLSRFAKVESSNSSSPFLCVIGNPVFVERFKPSLPISKLLLGLFRWTRNLASNSFIASTKSPLSPSFIATTAWLIVMPGAFVIAILGKLRTTSIHSSFVSKRYFTFPAAVISLLFSFHFFFPTAS